MSEHCLTIKDATRESDCERYFRGVCACGWTSKTARDDRSIVVEYQIHMHRAEIAAAEQRGAALAVEQCRRLAEEMAGGFVAISCDCGYTVDLDADGDGVSAHRALHNLIAGFPVSPDLAKEVRRIEERVRREVAEEIGGLKRELAECRRERDYNEF